MVDSYKASIIIRFIISIRLTPRKDPFKGGISTHSRARIIDYSILGSMGYSIIGERLKCMISSWMKIVSYGMLLYKVPYVKMKVVKYIDTFQPVPTGTMDYIEVGQKKIKKNYKEKKILACRIGPSEYNWVSSCKSVKDI